MKLVTLLDENDKPILILSNDLPKALPIVDDMLTVSIDDDFTNSLYIQTLGDHPSSVEIQKFRSFIYPYNDYEFGKYVIESIEEEKDDLYLRKANCTLSAYVDLTEDLIEPTKFTNAKVKDIVNTICANTGWEYDESLSDTLPVMNWEITDIEHPLKSLRDLAKGIEMELGFHYEMNKNKVVGQKIHFNKQINDDLGRISFSGKDIMSVHRVENTEDFVCGLYPVGPEKDGEIMTIKGYTPPSMPKGYTKEGAIVFRDDVVSQYGKFRIEKFALDKADSQQHMIDQAVEALENKYGFPQMTYVVELAFLQGKFVGGEDIRLGNKMVILDHGMMPPLSVSARVRQLNTSLSHPENNTSVLGNYVPLVSSVNEDLEKIKDTIRDNEEDWNASKWSVKVFSSNGLVFKNGQGQTILRAEVFKANKEYDAFGTELTYKWELRDANGSVIKEMTGKKIEATPQDFDQQGIYRVIVSLPEGI